MLYIYSMLNAYPAHFIFDLTFDFIVQYSSDQSVREVYVCVNIKCVFYP
jgi:hypothetical protein